MTRHRPPSSNNPGNRPTHDTSKSQREDDEAEALGETSEQHGRAERDEPLTAMTEGQDLGVTSPDVVTESPGGMNEERPPSVDRGFGDERDRRDR